MGGVDLSEFDAENGPPVQRMKLELIMDELDDDRLSKLQAALSDRTYTSAAIARVLVSWGFEISPDSVQTWRRRKC